MGKVKDEAPAKSSKPAPKGGSLRGAGRSIAPFLTNLVRAEQYKPNQGRHARIWTAVGLGVLVAAGLYRMHVTLLADQFSSLTSFGVPAALAAALGWIVYRVVQFPPFADFLIATEAEMNKVSWTSKDDLYRATTVVLMTVLILALYLLVVDWVWSILLHYLHVLRFSDTSSFGAQAG